MAAQADHYVPEAFLKLWSFVPCEGKEGPGKVYQYDKENPRRGWIALSTRNAAKEKGGDQLSPTEASELGVPTNALDVLIQPIEAKGLDAIRRVLVGRTEVRKRTDYLDLVKWILLQELRVPRGKKGVLPQTLLRELPGELGRPAGRDELTRFFKEHGATQNLLLFMAFRGEWFVPCGRNKCIEDIRGASWVVRRVGGYSGLICPDHPVCHVGGPPESYLVPLGPSAALIDPKKGRHPRSVQSKLLSRRALTKDGVTLLNGLLWKNAQRFVWARDRDPDHEEAGIAARAVEMFEF